MKNTRKLLSATLMLVIAFVAVAGSTFAWFTMSSEPKINDFEVNVYAGDALKIALKADALESDYYTNITQTMIEAEQAGFQNFDIYPATPSNEGVFTKLSLDEETGIFSEVAAVPGTDYIVIDLWIKSDTATSVYLKAANITPGSASKNDTTGAESARIGFLDSTSATPVFRIFEQNRTFSAIAPTTFGTFGAGDFFAKANLDSKGFSKLYNMGLDELEQPLPTILKPAGADIYTLDDPNNTAEASNYTIPGTPLTKPDNALVLLTLEANVAKKLQAIIWIEGWDGDCTDYAKGANLKVNFQFTGYTEAGN